MRVTVFRSVPPLIIGTCGVVPNRDFETFEERLDTLEATGVRVERFDPSNGSAITSIPAVERLVLARGVHCFPLVVVDGEIVAAGRYPTRAEWAPAIGAHRRQELMAPQ